MNQSPRSGRQRHPCDLVIASAIARSAGCKFFLVDGSWGFAALHPRLYAVGRFAGFIP